MGELTNVVCVFQRTVNKIIKDGFAGT